MIEKAIDMGRIERLIDEGLLRLPEENKKVLPAIVLKPDAQVFTYKGDNFLILSIVNSQEKKRLSALVGKGVFPYPSLIKPYFVSAPAAFALEKSKNALITNCSVSDIFSFSLGKDCTIILQNHKQAVRTKKVGVCEYVIDLAFVLSFGDEINSNNVYDFIVSLIGYYVSNSKSVTAR